MECMKHINRIVKFSNIDDSPLTQYMNSDFFYTRANNRHRLPVAWFKSERNRTECETCGTASFIWEVPKIIEA